MGDVVVGPVLVLGGRGAALLGAAPDVPAVIEHAALHSGPHSASGLDGAQLYDAAYRRLAPVTDGAGTLVDLRPAEGPGEPTDETARRERVRADLTRALALLRRALAVQRLHQQAATALATATELSGGVKDPLVPAAVTAAGELVEASRALLTAAGMQPVALATVADPSALLVDLAAPDLHAGLDGALARLVQRFGAVAHAEPSAGPGVDPNSGSLGHLMLHAAFGDFHREPAR